jgi:hypothetical protein
MVNTKQISAMLEWISRVDRFVQPDLLTVRAWSDVLRDDMDSTWAKEFLVRHYNHPEATTVTAGMINHAWANRRNGNINACTVCEPGQGCHDRTPTPMPDWFREQFAAITKAKAMDSR